MATYIYEEQTGGGPDRQGSATPFHALAVAVDENHDLVTLRRAAAEILARYSVISAQGAVINIEGEVSCTPRAPVTSATSARSLTMSQQPVSS